eukprot:7039893-Alexandrium_andersonii.AAC.1
MAASGVAIAMPPAFRMPPPPLVGLTPWPCSQLLLAESPAEGSRNTALASGVALGVLSALLWAP